MNALRIAFGRNAPPMFSLSNRLTSINGFHTLLSRAFDNRLQSSVLNCRLPSLLAPVSVVQTPICGFKFKAVIKKRCKDCYIVVKDRQKIMLCTTHKRHKTKEIVPKEKDTWIITHRTHGKIRPW